MNRASSWRLEAAGRLAEAYAQIPAVACVIAASSTARGHADRFSDLDLVVLWEAEPTETQRRGTIQTFDADLVGLYPYDESWRCWSDMFALGRAASGEAHTGLAVDVTHVLVSTARALLRSVAEEADTSEPAHNLAALVSGGIPLHGAALVGELKASLSYPDDLAAAMVMKVGQVDYFWRWRSSLARGENLMLFQANMVQFAQKLLRTLLALNRVYFFGFGWLDEVLARLDIAPVAFTERFRAMWRLEPAAQAAALAALFEETYDLVQAHLPGADVARLRRLFRLERTFWDEPPPGLAENEADVF